MTEQRPSTFLCPDCETRYKVPKSIPDTGVKVKCGTCGSIIKLIEPAETLFPVSLTWFRQSLVRKKNGNIVKIASWDSLLSLIDDGTVAAEDEISSDGMKWKTLNDMPELTHVLSPEPPEPVFDNDFFSDCTITETDGTAIIVKDLADLHMCIARRDVSANAVVLHPDSGRVSLGSIDTLRPFFDLVRKAEKPGPKSEPEFSRRTDPLEEQLREDEEDDTAPVDDPVQQEAKKSLAEIMAQQKQEKEQNKDEQSAEAENTAPPEESGKQSLADVLHEEESQEEQKSADSETDPKQELKDIIDRHTESKKSVDSSNTETTSPAPPPSESSKTERPDKQRSSSIVRNESEATVEDDDDELARLLEDDDDIIFEERTGSGKLLYILILFVVLAGAVAYWYFFQMDHGDRITADLSTDQTSENNAADENTTEKKTTAGTGPAAQKQKKSNTVAAVNPDAEPKKIKAPAMKQKKKRRIRKKSTPRKTVRRRKKPSSRTKRHRSSPRRAASRGWKLIDKGDFAGAIRIFTGIIRTTPTYADAYYGLAEAYNLKGEKKKAVTFYRKYLKTDEGQQKKTIINNIIKNISN